ncbi:Galactose oxidase [Pseudocercospora fuligena]|uniref:Galactose oxidase n=1 Tax=Pseudocercospora fuligena TaxID=685502 RepID=A0A8H6REK7_9PEZI|nr:Galactose oxidase [Pseudocercospora fuligena]
MKLQWSQVALATAVSASHKYLEEAMRGERVSGYGTYDKPSWEPIFKDQSPPYKAHRITREDWDLSCSSGETSCREAIDGSNSTAWRSEPDQSPHITIDLHNHYAVSAVVVLPPIDLTSSDGLITHHEIYLSNDAQHWGSPVAHGMWPMTNRQRLAAFEPTSARYVRLVATPSNEGSPFWIGISELNVYANLYTHPKDPSRGIWGPTIDLPVVPASAAQVATGQVMLWSSWADDQFHSTPGGKTAMTFWDFRNNTVSKRIVSNTHHDMFCPGIAIDGTGNMIVTGGNDAAQTSLFTASENEWHLGKPMKLERGYQSQTALSDGRVFVIGGSWAGGSNIDKNGEIYDPATMEWSSLPGAKVEPMLTDDMEGPWRADNHGWLFGWRHRTVFQAGPSKSMNWYFVEGNGSVLPAGQRLDDEDSMSGNAVMFDATKGKILTFGGSPDYEKSLAHANAHIITLGNPGDEVDVRPAGHGGAMHYKRVFHTSVVLPDGKVFIVGGQTFGVAFNEENIQFTPELYDPETDTFEKMQRNNIVRTYHSVSVLVPDGRVLTGGGGLCGNCSANHYDAQLFTPPYLLTDSGDERERPAFLSNLPHTVGVGGQLYFSTTTKIASAALVRISSASHTVNTDQRRVPLALRRYGFFSNRYTVQVPTDPGVVIPGYWMLFVMDVHGTPSIAHTILITVKENSKHRTAFSDGSESYLYRIQEALRR